MRNEEVVRGRKWEQAGGYYCRPFFSSAGCPTWYKSYSGTWLTWPMRFEEKMKQTEGECVGYDVQ